jgi:hypothetical protein
MILIIKVSVYIIITLREKAQGSIAVFTAKQETKI